MRKIILTACLGLMMAACTGPEGQFGPYKKYVFNDNPSYYVYYATIEIDGHQYIVTSQDGITHSASCPCHDKHEAEYRVEVEKDDDGLW